MPVKETVLEISFKNLKENFKFLKSKINPTTKFMAVVRRFHMVLILKLFLKS